MNPKHNFLYPIIRHFLQADLLTDVSVVVNFSLYVFSLVSAAQVFVLVVVNFQIHRIKTLRSFTLFSMNQQNYKKGSVFFLFFLQETKRSTRISKSPVSFTSSSWDAIDLSKGIDFEIGSTYHTFTVNPRHGLHLVRRMLKAL